jgi:N-acetylglucosamine kinase-like BadF-type ATPase
VAAVLNAHGAGEEPPLLERILSIWNLNSLDELVRHANASPPPDFASLVPVILEAAENPRPSRAWTGHPEGSTPPDSGAGSADAVAGTVLRRAGQELAALACSLARRLFAATDTVPVAMSGGVFREAERVRQVFYNGVTAEFPQAQVNPDVVDPLAGALALARKMADGAKPR